MYLGIFVIVCISFGLVQSDQGLAKQDGVLQCPNCLVQGDQADAEASCEKATDIKPCREIQPVCAQITGPGVFQRLCASQAEFDNFKASCETDNSCQVVKLSSTPAQRPSLTENEGLAEQDDVLQCPNCLVQGDQADAEASCVNVTEIKPCREPQPVCAQITGPGVFQRLCVSQSEFDNFKASCETDNSCQVVKLSSPPAPRQKLPKRRKTCYSPSANIQGGVPEAKVYNKDQVITAWNLHHPNSHAMDGFKYADGKLTVPIDGRYYVYAQIYFNSRPEKSLNRIAVFAGNRVLLMIQEDMAAGQEKTGFTGGVFQLSTGDEIYVKVIGQFDSKLYVGPNHSYFGAYLVSRIPCNKKAMKDGD